ncbi:hypothetical protein LX36DRAFT_433343 [Colletotrichum falcatum]|nr:hypothetical protein LX36DRAFT_433343 [Colletotrichum falcatum]
MDCLHARAKRQARKPNCSGRPRRILWLLMVSLPLSCLQCFYTAGGTWTSKCVGMEMSRTGVAWVDWTNQAKKAHGFSRVA